MKNIFAYWTGEKPSLIEVLHAIAILHSRNGANYRFNLLTKDDFLDSYSDIPGDFQLLCPAHQADVVRVWTLCEHGGIWLDSDTLVLSSLSDLFEICEKKNGFFMTQNNQCLFNGVFGSKKDTPLMRNWKKYILETLETNGPHIEWEQIGNKFLTHTLVKEKQYFENYFIFNGLQTMYPVNWDQCVNAYLEKPYWTHRHLIRDFQPLLVLVNSVYKALSSHSKKQIIESEYPLNYFINKSLQELIT